MLLQLMMLILNKLHTVNFISCQYVSYLHYFLNISIECHADCFTCSGLDSDECLSCDLEGTNYLTDTNTCGDCDSDQYHDDDFVCQDCDALCTACTSFGTDTVDNECACALKTHGTTCLEECPENSTHDREDVCIGKFIRTSY